MDPLSLIFALVSIPFIGNLISNILLPKLIKIDFQAYEHGDGILLDFETNRTLGDYKDNDRIICSNTSISITFENLSDSGTIKIAPFAFLRVYSRFEIPSNTASYVSPKDGLGGGGMPRYFYGSLSSKSPDVVCASYIDNEFSLYLEEGTKPSLPNVKRREFEFFTLAPDELETIILNIPAEDGYFYEFDVGVPIKIRGSERIIWSKKRFTIAIPKTTTYYRSSRIIPYGNDLDLGDTPEDSEDYVLTPWFDQEAARSHWLEADYPDRRWVSLLVGLCTKYGFSEFKARPDRISRNSKIENSLVPRMNAAK